MGTIDRMRQFQKYALFTDLKKDQWPCFLIDQCSPLVFTYSSLITMFIVWLLLLLQLELVASFLF